MNIFVIVPELEFNRRITWTELNIFTKILEIIMNGLKIYGLLCIEIKFRYD